MSGRTDLALEAVGGGSRMDGVYQTVRKSKEVTVSVTEIQTAAAARALGKPCGRYVTVELPALSDDEREMEARALRVAAPLKQLLPPHGTVLVVGLGNRHMTPDALGPQVADMVLATRHIRGEWARSVGLERLRPVAVCAPGVLGQTGLESLETVRGLCRQIKPAAVVAVDALAARSLSRLGCTVQLCDTGIAPGSGVGNNRRALNAAGVGCPVIGMGVPTVVDGATLVRELGGTPCAAAAQMMVTPREVDLTVRRASRLVAMALNGALQPDYSPLELIAAAM